MPVLTTLKGWKYGFHSPFKEEVYFVSTRQFTDLKWGTKNPVMLRDPEFGPIRLRSFGTYALRVKDPAALMREVAGTQSRFTAEGITDQLRNIIITRFSDTLAESKVPALDLAAQYNEISAMIQERIAGEFQEYGLELVKFLVENISFPPEVEAALDKRTSMGVLGDMNRFMQYQSANAMMEAAQNPSGGAGEGIGMGMGFAMANQMARQSMGVGSGPAPAEVPPPLPQTAGAPVVYVALDGQQSGPHAADQLRQMIQAGKLSRETLVWKKGLGQWVPARDLPETAELLAELPPPLP